MRIETKHFQEEQFSLHVSLPESILSCINIEKLVLYSIRYKFLLELMLVLHHAPQPALPKRCKQLLSTEAPQQNIERRAAGDFQRELQRVSHKENGKERGFSGEKRETYPPWN